MSDALPKHYKEIANSMGISLYQRFSLNEASLFLRCQTQNIEKLVCDGEIGFINIPNAESCFLGYQLLEYVLENTTERNAPNTEPSMKQAERILRIKKVIELTGLSRTTIWRMERKGEFPARVQLGVGSVGWRYSEVNGWIKARIVD
jgi:predicted DNA-binding transcriptional regulator AlpA